jgi:hypothetical protein
MPAEYESVVTALRTVATSKLTLEGVRQHIEEFEDDRKTKKKKTTNVTLTTAYSNHQFLPTVIMNIWYISFFSSILIFL